MSWTASPAAISTAIVAIFVILILNCLFLDKGYYEAIPQDLFGYLDGVYRAHLGQIAHRDFSSSLGPLQLLLPSLFMGLGADALSSVRYYNAALLIFALIVVLYLYRTRLGNAVAVALAMFIALTLAAKLVIGDNDPQDSSGAMFYNRIGYVLLVLQLMLYVAPADSSDSKRRYFIAAADGALSGFLCALAFYIKSTFGLVGAGMIVLSLFFPGERREKIVRTSASLAAIAIMAAIVEVGYGVHFRWLRDMRMAAISVEGLRTWKTPVRKILLSISEIIAGVLVPFAVVWMSGARIPRAWFLLAAFVVAASAALATYSAQGPALFLPVGFLLFATAQMERLTPGDRQPVNGVSFEAFRLGLIGWCVLTIVMTCYPLLYNVVYSTVMYRNGVALEGDPRILRAIRTRGAYQNPVGRPLLDYVNRLPPLDVFVLGRTSKGPDQWDFLSFIEYGIYASEGVKAARRGCPDRARIANLDAANPFPVLLSWPEGGGMLFVAPQYLLSKRIHPTPEAMYGKIDCVLAPKMQAGEGTKQFLLDIYGQYLQDHFKQSYDSEFWTVLERNGAEASIE